MTFTKIALLAAMMTGAAIPAQAATTTFTGRGQTISLEALSPSVGTLESVVYNISYDLGATFINRSDVDQNGTFSGFVGANPFGFSNFGTSRLVLASEQQASFSATVFTFGTLTGSALSTFLGSGLIGIIPSGSISSNLGPSLGGSTIASYSVTYNYALANAVPEPSSWALMLAGFGLTGYALRRRRTRWAFA